ncbi:MAG: HDOD domain-containing protein [Desulfobacteraceae bacterium]
MSSVKRINKARALLKGFREMKTIPAVAVRLIAMIEDDGSTLKEFEQVIKVDPTLVLRLLKLVNSSFFGLRVRIKTIPEAVAYVGMDNLRNLIVLDALKTLFSKPSHGEKFSRERLWLHCAATGICCKMISERIFVQKGEDAFLCGILHDIGLIVEEQTVPDRFHEFCVSFDPETEGLIDQESRIIGTDHPTTGYVLTGEWQLAPDIGEAVKVHHTTLETIEPKSLAGILQMAEYLVSRLHYSAFPEEKVGLTSPPLLVHMKENIVEYRAIVDDLPGEMQKAEEIYSLEDNHHG